jgi:dolichol-phosphate mannosyltransferase
VSTSVVVIPTYNEAASVGTVLDRVLEATTSDILVVDDNSPDGTAGIVTSHSAFGSRVFLLSRPGKEGLGGAYRAGFGWSLDRDYDAVVQMDADLSHPPESVPEMLEQLRCFGSHGTADVVIGSRYVPGGRTANWPWSRRMISRGGNVYVRIVLGLPVHDATAGFRAYSADALRSIDVLATQSNGYAFQVENTWRAVRAGLDIVEVPITFTDRLDGQSKMTAAIAREAVTRVLLWRIVELRDWFNHRVLRRGSP